MHIRILTKVNRKCRRSVHFHPSPFIRPSFSIFRGSGSGLVPKLMKRGLGTRVSFYICSCLWVHKRKGRSCLAWAHKRKGRSCPAWVHKRKGEELSCMSTLEEGGGKECSALNGCCRTAEPPTCTIARAYCDTPSCPSDRVPSFCSTKAEQMHVQNKVWNVFTTLLLAHVLPVSPKQKKYTLFPLHGEGNYEP